MGGVTTARPTLPMRRTYSCTSSRAPFRRDRNQSISPGLPPHATRARGRPRAGRGSTAGASARRRCRCRQAAGSPASSPSRSRSRSFQPPQLRVERVAQRVGHQRERGDEGRHEDRRRGELPPVAEDQLALQTKAVLDVLSTTPGIASSRATTYTGSRRSCWAPCESPRRFPFCRFQLNL